MAVFGLQIAAISLSSMASPIAINSPTPTPGLIRHRVAFDVERSTQQDTAGRGRCAVWGLDPIRRKAIESLARPSFEAGTLIPTPTDVRLSPLDAVVGTSLTTYATVIAGLSGAGASPAKVGVGVVERVITERDGGDLVTSLEIDDIAIRRSYGVASRTFERGTSGLVVLEYLARAAGLLTGFVTPTFASAVELAGFVAASQDPLEVMREFFDAADYDWWVDLSTLWVTRRGEALPLPPVTVSLVAGPGVGLLLEDPRVGADGRLELVCSLLPRVQPGQRVVVATPDAAGTYRAEVVRHAGDTDGDLWRTELICGRILL